MSGESVLAFFRKPKTDPFQARLEVESDRRLFGCMGSGSTFGVVLVVYALSIQIIPDPFTGGKPPVIEPPVWPNHPHLIEVIRVRPPVNYHGSIKERRLAKADAHAHPGPGAGRQSPKPKAAKPALKDPGVLVAAVIASKGSLGSMNAYDIIGKSVRNVDLDKLDGFGSLTRTDKTRLGGRLGKQSHAFNEVYDEGGTGDTDPRVITIPGLPRPSGIPGTPRGPVAAVTQVAIDMFQNATSRSTASILAVIRSHSPGLRHVYNACLKLRPGLAGKITLRFAIAPSGEVVDVGLAGSTTSDAAFDARVVEKALAWRFEPVKAIGNDIVTVPFNFSE